MAFDLSKRAQQDLEDIYDFTVAEFGLNQADSYVLEFKASFVHLSENPKIGRERSEIRKGLRSLAKDNHIIFYRIIKTRTFIVRILHGSRDLPKQFLP